MDPRIEVSIWERICAFNPASAEEREKFSKFLIRQRERRNGTTITPHLVDRSTKAETYSDLYAQDWVYTYPGSTDVDVVLVLAPDGISAFGPEALEALRLIESVQAELNEEAA